MDAKRDVSAGIFAAICLGAFLLSIAYGLTFLLPLLLGMRGGDESDAGAVIAIASVSTVMMVLVAGHISDRLGATRAVALSGLFLMSACLGFSYIDTIGSALLVTGLMLGLGWGLFFALWSIVVSAIVSPERRVRCFALVSGCMMSGFAAGPLIGRVISHWGGTVDSAFLVGACTSLSGTAVFLLVDGKLRKGTNASWQISRITFKDAVAVLASNARFPIVMVGLLGALFGGVSSFQTSFAVKEQLDYSLFYIAFMMAAIGSRLFLSGYVVTRNLYLSSCILSGLIACAIAGFMLVNGNAAIYVFSSALLGLGYGLCYSVINGLVVNDAPDGLIPQSLLVFSLSYLVCVFMFPLAAGHLIVSIGMDWMFSAILGLALTCCLTAFLGLSSHLRFTGRRMRSGD